MSLATHAARLALLALTIAACAGTPQAGVAPTATSPTGTPAGTEAVAPTAPFTAAEFSPTQTVAAASTTTEAPTRAPTPRPSTPRPTAVATQTSGAYTTIAPGTPLPSEAQCAAGVGSNPWEPRPDNRAANQTNAWVQGFRLTGSYLATMAAGYQERVTGNFTGTTDQILRWGACKWGFDEQDVRAQAVIEATWRQSTLGDCNHTTQPQTKGCASVGILQVKGADIPATHPGTFPAAMTSTAFNVDYALAVRRLCFDGKETWLRQLNATYAAGDLWGCIGRWYSGRWHDTAAEQYIGQVRATLAARPWLSPTF